MKTMLFTVTMHVEVEQRADPGPDEELTAESIRQHFEREEITLRRYTYNFGDATIFDVQVEVKP